MRKRTDGFTLVELMVVVLIIGILVAVAVPVFNAAKTRAETNTCQANQRTWAGVVQQIKAADDEPGAGTAGYMKLATGADQSVWYDKAISYVKKTPICPASGGTPYWVYDAPAGGAGNGTMVACQGTDSTKQAWATGHPLVGSRTLAQTGAHRYWRILATSYVWYGNGSPKYSSEIAEISLFAASSVPAVNPANDSGNLCRSAGSTVSASSERDSSLGAAGARDGILGWPGVWCTSYAQEATPAWWALDLGAGNASEVHAVQLMAWWDDWVSRTYALQWSDNGSDWTTSAVLETEKPGATHVNNKTYKYNGL